MSDALRTKVVYLALAIGCVLSLSSLTVWVLRAEFGTAGASFLSAGCLLIGLSVFTRASIQAGPLKAEFESDANKRFAAIATTDVEMEKAVREALAAEGAAAQDPDELASSVLREVRSRAFLTLDTRPFLGAQGREVRAPYSDFESIGLFLRYAWFAMEGSVVPQRPAGVGGSALRRPWGPPGRHLTSVSHHAARRSACEDRLCDAWRPCRSPIEGC